MLLSTPTTGNSPCQASPDRLLFGGALVLAVRPVGSTPPLCHVMSFSLGVGQSRLHIPVPCARQESKVTSKKVVRAPTSSESLLLFLRAEPKSGFLSAVCHGLPGGRFLAIATTQTPRDSRFGGLRCKYEIFINRIVNPQSSTQQKGHNKKPTSRSLSRSSFGTLHLHP